MSTFEIIPVHVGSRKADSSLFYYLSEPHELLTIHYRLWVVRNASMTLLVDSGLPPEEALRRGITDAREVESALGAYGIDAGEIDTVVLTHLHWDHASNADRFPRATFVAQKAEVDWLTDPKIAQPSIGRFYSDIEKFQTMVTRGRFRLLQGDERLADGIEAVRVGGHTPGSQMLFVDVPGGRAVIAGDAIPLNRNFLGNVPPGIHLNLCEAIDALERARSIKPVALFTGHDPIAKLDLTDRPS